MHRDLNNPATRPLEGIGRAHSIVGLLYVAHGKVKFESVRNMRCFHLRCGVKHGFETDANSAWWFQKIDLTHSYAGPELFLSPLSERGQGLRDPMIFH